MGIYDRYNRPGSASGLDRLEVLIPELDKMFLKRYAQVLGMSMGALVRDAISSRLPVWYSWAIAEKEALEEAERKRNKRKRR
jgi:hypothetical protein